MNGVHCLAFILIWEKNHVTVTGFLLHKKVNRKTFSGNLQIGTGAELFLRLLHKLLSDLCNFVTPKQYNLAAFGVQEFLISVCRLCWLDR